MNIVVKVHKSEGRVILAMCDEEVIGKVFEEGNKILDTASNFYNGLVMDEESIKKYLKISYIINAVGKNSVDLLLKQDIIDDDKVMKISDIPYAQAVITAEN